MKTFIIEIEGFTAGELLNNSPYSTFEKVRFWFVNRFKTNEELTEIYNQHFRELFPNSSLDACFWLDGAQGDGFNTEGEILLTDFLNVWDGDDDDKKTIKKYLDYIAPTYEFYCNLDGAFSCKFIDEKLVAEDIENAIITLENFAPDIEKVDKMLIAHFFNDLIEYFYNLDKKLETFGYDYFAPTDEKIVEECDANEYYFTKEGVIIEL